MTLACSECITGDDKTCKRCEGQAMTDDIMTRVREWLASCVRVATENGVPEEADLEAAALAFIDGEPARMAAAREEQREACASVVLRDSLPNAREALRDAIRNTPLAATPLADEIAALRARVAELEADLEVGRETCRRHGTTSGTGADGWSASKLIGFLSHNIAGKDAALKDSCAVWERYKAERDALRASLRELREIAERNVADVQHLRQSAIALTTERDALRAQLLSERERLERWLTAPDGKQYERGTVQAVFDECDALRAQMEAAREAAERIVKTQWRMPDCYITATAILRAMDEAKP